MGRTTGCELSDLCRTERFGGWSRPGASRTAGGSCSPLPRRLFRRIAGKVFKIPAATPGSVTSVTDVATGAPRPGLTWNVSVTFAWPPAPLGGARAVRDRRAAREEDRRRGRSRQHVASDWPALSSATCDVSGGGDEPRAPLLRTRPGSLAGLAADPPVRGLDVIGRDRGELVRAGTVAQLRHAQIPRCAGPLVERASVPAVAELVDLALFTGAS